jgi:hypothetical protein
MSVQQNYENAMLFLIAIHKKTNKFDLGVEGCQQSEISERIHMLAIKYINNKLGKVKDIPDIIEKITVENDYFTMVITPI